MIFLGERQLNKCDRHKRMKKNVCRRSQMVGVVRTGDRDFLTKDQGQVLD
jgi:hypothetical protein